MSFPGVMSRLNELLAGKQRGSADCCRDTGGMSAPITDFARAPFLVLWELTRACALACKHCRAEAIIGRDERELSTEEACALLDHMRAEFGPCLIVLTGGDPLERPDILTLIRYGASLGLRMTLTPAATPALTQKRLWAVRDAGIARVAISLDGADRYTHDGFRQNEGTFARTMEALQWCREAGIETQINSSIGKHNQDQLDDLAEIVRWYGCRLWSVFLIVPTGRAERELLANARQHEAIYQRLADIGAEAPFDIKTTAGQPFYRVQAQRLQAEHPELSIEELNPQRFGLRAPRGVNDGNGVVFIGHEGTVHPSGFLPIDCGTVRETPLATIYREHPVFRELRDPDLLVGKCGRCDYRRLCGGSRSRSYGLLGSHLASDPTCVYLPPR